MTHQLQMRHQRRRLLSKDDKIFKYTSHQVNIQVRWALFMIAYMYIQPHVVCSYSSSTAIELFYLNCDSKTPGLFDHTPQIFYFRLVCTPPLCSPLTLLLLLSSSLVHCIQPCAALTIRRFLRAELHLSGMWRCTGLVGLCSSPAIRIHFTFLL